MKSFKTPKGTELPILNLKGKDYMQVQPRTVWFREERPDWSIETEFVERGADYAIAKATIKDEKGRIIATSHKKEDQKGFPDNWIEKSETSAIGRALALCGFGTQFCGDELDEGGRLADSPTSRESDEMPAWVTEPEMPLGEEIPSPNGPTPFDLENSVFNGNLGAYAPTFGKFRGKRFDSIPPDEIANYSQWLIRDAKEKNKAISKGAQDFLDTAKQYLTGLGNNQRNSR